MHVLRLALCAPAGFQQHQAVGWGGGGLELACARGLMDGLCNCRLWLPCVVLSKLLCARHGVILIRSRVWVAATRVASCSRNMLRRCTGKAR